MLTNNLRRIIMSSSSSSSSSSHHLRCYCSPSLSATTTTPTCLRWNVTAASDHRRRRYFFTSFTSPKEDDDDESNNTTDDTTTTTTTTDDDTTTSSSQEYYTGTVKFYKNKVPVFGFINVDNPPDDEQREIWCHRDSIECNIDKDSSDYTLFRPYLLKGERVRFQIVPTHTEPTKYMAHNIVFDHDDETKKRLIPLYRKNYLSHVRDGEMKRFGLQVFDIMNNPMITNEMKMDEIQEAMVQTKQTIDTADDNVRKDQRRRREGE